MKINLADYFKTPKGEHPRCISLYDECLRYMSLPKGKDKRVPYRMSREHGIFETMIYTPAWSGLQLTNAVIIDRLIWAIEET